MTTDRWTDGPQALYERRVKTMEPGRKGRNAGRLGQWTVAILVVVASTIGAAYLYAQKGDTTEVLVLAREVPPGHQITTADLGTAEVSGVVEVIEAEDANEVLGQYTVNGMTEGQILSPDAVTTHPMPGDGQRLVALNIPAGRLPSGVTAGSAVEVLAAPAPGEGAVREQLDAPQVIAARASAHSVEQVADGTVVVTLLVPEADADIVATHSAAGAVTVVQVPVGE